MTGPVCLARRWRCAARAAALVAAVAIGPAVTAGPAQAREGADAVSVSPVADGRGHVVAFADGTVHVHGSARHHGDLAAGQASVAGVAATDGDGYWLVETDGTIHAFGDAPRLPGPGAGTRALGAEVVALRPVRGDSGYWVIDASGDVVAVGDARHHGSMRGVTLNLPVIDMAVTSSGDGYWLVAADGGIFAFGDAPFHGSMGGVPLNAPITGMSAAPDDGGYVLFAADGGVFAFGSVEFGGSLVGSSAVVVDGEAHPSGTGYLLALSDGSVVRRPAATPALQTSQLLIDLAARLNDERRHRGIAPLRSHPALSATAGRWVEGLSPRLTHSDLSATLGGLGGEFGRLAENLAWGGGTEADSGSLHVALMGSAAHRAAMLDPAATTVGLAVRCVGDVALVVVHLGRLAAEGHAGPAPPAPAAPVVRSDTGGPSCARPPAS